MGRKSELIATQLVALLLRVLPLPERALLVIDDSPTARPSSRPFTTSKRHDAKEVWGSGQQQVRNIWTNLAVYNLNLWMHTLVELWAWGRSHEELCDRSDSPWDDAHRRPSHANRRWRLTQTHFPKRIIDDRHRVVSPTKNHPTGQKPHGIGYLN